jgi:enoyl-CoA hydratase/carnithine racemase
METLRVERAGNGVVTLTLDRPEKKNAMNAAMFNELLAVFREVNDSTTDRVLVVTGAGGRLLLGSRPQ